MLQIEPVEKKTLKQVLSKYPYQFYAYGSRVKGNARQFSDLDLCYQAEIPLITLSQIREELEDSNLPFIVELVNWKQMSQSFQESIKEDLLRI